MIPTPSILRAFRALTIIFVTAFTNRNKIYSVALRQNGKRNILMWFGVFQISIIFLSGGLGASAQEPVNYCSLFNSLENNGKSFLTKAILYSLSKDALHESLHSENYIGEYLYSGKCNNLDYFADIDSSLAQKLNLLKTKAKKLSGNSQKDSFRLYEVTFEGEFLISLQAKFGNLGMFRSQFKITSIRSVKPISKTNNLPNINDRTAIIGRTNSLRSLNNDVIFYLFGFGNNPDYLVTDQIVPSNTKINANGKFFPIKDLTEALKVDNSGELGVQVTDIKKEMNTWELIGTVTNKRTDGSVKKLTFANKYLVQNDKSEKLIAARINEIK